MCALLPACTDCGENNPLPLVLIQLRIVFLVDLLIDKIITYDGGIIIRLIYDHLFYKANDVEIEVGNNTTINKKNLADVFLLQIISELRTLRKIISGGSGNGQH